MENPPAGWRLFRREERQHEGQPVFRERWVHDGSNSGITYLCFVEAGRLKYVVEGYGLGTVDPANFRELAEQAPIERSEYWELPEAAEALRELMREYNRRWEEGGRGLL